MSIISSRKISCGSMVMLQRFCFHQFRVKNDLVALSKLHGHEILQFRHVFNYFSYRTGEFLRSRVTHRHSLLVMSHIVMSRLTNKFFFVSLARLIEFPHLYMFLCVVLKMASSVSHQDCKTLKMTNALVYD